MQKEHPRTAENSKINYTITESELRTERKEHVSTTRRIMHGYVIALSNQGFGYTPHSRIESKRLRAHPLACSRSLRLYGILYLYDQLLY